MSSRSPQPSPKVSSKDACQTSTKYKGLFSSQNAPTSRAYCVLFSFFVGVLLVTMGSVFYHVILNRPMSGMRPIHTPPMPLACILVATGIFMVLLSIGIVWRYGLDDGDDSLEDDMYIIAKDDVLEDQHHFSQKIPPV
ncbi:uncharacterized protein LOC135222296 [Macrobrachium nipponense]|uniref:uncharacterized protein LOC135222296 n=1 Tax=Macrobrachium nipponense TaxID=159736 RepID=UPI0030C7D4AB